MANIVELLQKLINHERSARDIGNTAEAEAFAAKIQTLLTEHKLSMSEVEYQAQEQNDPIGHQYVTAQDIGQKISQRGETWQARLGDAIAKNFFCKVLSVTSSKTLIFIGRQSDRAAAVEMYRYLVGLALTLCEKECKAWKQTHAYEAELDNVTRWGWYSATAGQKAAVVRIWKNSYLMGFYMGIAKRLNSNRQELETKATEQAQGLILRDAAAIQKYQDSNFSVGSARQSGPSNWNSGAVRLGQQHGSSAPLKSRMALGAG